jgi:hypothetical protein
MPIVWRNMVDITNGSYDEQGKRIDRHITLKIKLQRKCKCCGAILETIYHIPKTKSKGDRK